MTVKQYIQQLLVLERQIRFTNAQAQKWHDIAYGQSSPMSDNERVQTSVGDRMADAVSMYITMESKYKNCLLKYRELYDTIDNQLANMSEPLYGEVLRRHLIAEETLYEIGIDSGYSYRQIKRKYTAAVMEFADKYLKDVPKCPQMSPNVP